MVFSRASALERELTASWIFFGTSKDKKVLCVRSNISVAELARRVGTSPQNFNAKLKRESFTVNDMEEIARAVDCSFERNFILQNGDKV